MGIGYILFSYAVGTFAVKKKTHPHRSRIEFAPNNDNNNGGIGSGIHYNLTMKQIGFLRNGSYAIYDAEPPEENKKQSIRM